MKILIQEANTNYRLLDSGNGLKLEQFGSNTIIRPDNTCLWQQHAGQEAWDKSCARYNKQATGPLAWQKKQSFKEPWLFTYHLPLKSSMPKTSITCQLKLSTSKNIGIFPEHTAQWAWMIEHIQAVKHCPLVLNLFAYTGGASLCAAAAGAQVTHVDASQAAVTWARANQRLSKLDNTPIRWIVEDCAQFVTREIKRGTLYDALIFDPPAFGRDPKGKSFVFEKQISSLLDLCQKVLKPKPLFVIFNGYAMGHSATILKNLLSDYFPHHTIEFGELHVQEYTGKRNIPCSIFARLSGL